MDYQSRVRGPATRAGIPPRGGSECPFSTAVRATASTVVVCCLTVAVPCLVFAVVGWWFHDNSTADSAQIAAVAALSAVLCHRRIVQHRPGGCRRAMWN